jgi:hypothetical protein
MMNPFFDLKILWLIPSLLLAGCFDLVNANNETPTNKEDVIESDVVESDIDEEHSALTKIPDTQAEKKELDGQWLDNQSGVSSALERKSLYATENDSPPAIGNTLPEVETYSPFNLKIDLLEKNHLLMHKYSLTPENFKPNRELHLSHHCEFCGRRSVHYLWWIDINRDGKQDEDEPVRSETSYYKIQMRDRGARLALKVSVEGYLMQPVNEFRYFDIFFGPQSDVMGL